MPHSGTCYRKSVCRLSSSEKFVHPTQPVKIFSSVSIYAILYASRPLAFMQNFTEVVLGEPRRRGLNARVVAKYSDVGHAEVKYLGNGARYGLGYN